MLRESGGLFSSYGTIAATFLEGRTVDDTMDQGAEFAAILFHGSYDLINGRGVVVFHAASSCISQQFGGDAAIKIGSPGCCEDLIQLRNGIEFFASDELSSRLNRATIFLIAKHADGIEVLQGEP